MYKLGYTKDFYPKLRETLNNIYWHYEVLSKRYDSVYEAAYYFYKIEDKRVWVSLIASASSGMDRRVAHECVTTFKERFLYIYP